MSPKVGKQVSKAKGDRSEIVHTRITPATYNRLIYVADESGWTLSTAINACIERGLDEIENYLDYFADWEEQHRQEQEEQVALEKQAEEHDAAIQAMREKRAAERVRHLKKQGKIKS